MHLVGPPLQHGRDRKPAIGPDHATDGAGGQRLHRGGKRRLREIGRAQPADVATSSERPGIVAPPGRHRREALSGLQLVRRGAGAIFRHRRDQRDFGQQRPLIGQETPGGEAVAAERRGERGASGARP